VLLAGAVEGLVVVVKVFAGLLTVGRGEPGSWFLFLSRQEKEPKESDPDSPETPKIKRAGWAAKNSPRFCRVDLIFVSGAQTPLPLIHPPHLIFGRAVRGRKSKPGK